MEGFDGRAKISNRRIIRNYVSLTITTNNSKQDVAESNSKTGDMR